SYRFLTEREVMDDCEQTAGFCPLLRQFKAIFLAGFHGDDLQTRVDHYSNCGTQCVSRDPLTDGCLMHYLDGWVSDQQTKGTLIGVFQRPLETGRADDGTLSGPCWKLWQMAGLGTTAPNEPATGYRNGAASGIPDRRALNQGTVYTAGDLD